MPPNNACAIYSATGISPEVTQGMQLSNKNNIVLAWVLVQHTLEEMI